MQQAQAFRALSGPESGKVYLPQESPGDCLCHCWTAGRVGLEVSMWGLCMMTLLIQMRVRKGPVRAHFDSESYFFKLVEFKHSWIKFLDKEKCI